MKKTQLAAAIAIAVSGAVIAPQASAGDHKGMQSQINALSSMMKQMQKELKRVKSAGGSQSLQEWENTVNAVKKLSEKKDMVRFTGGWNHVNQARGGFAPIVGTAGGTKASAGLLSAQGAATGGTYEQGTGASGDPLAGKCGGDSNTVTASCKVPADAWDFGFGFDHHISDDTMGLLPGVDFIAELMINYSEFADGHTRSAVTGQKVTVNEISISASPKLKYADGIMGIQPWAIPMGVELNVISPPSGAVTVTSIGSVHAVGFDYNLIGNVYLGGEGRYHWTPDSVDGVDTDGFTLSGSVGFGF